MIMFTVSCMVFPWLRHVQISSVKDFILPLFCNIQLSLSQFGINILNICQSEDQDFPKQKDGEIAQENTLGKKADKDEVVLSATCKETKPSIKIC